EAASRSLAPEIPEISATKESAVVFFCREETFPAVDPTRSPPPVLDRKRRHPACRSLPASLPRTGSEPDLLPETRSRRGCPRFRRLRKIQGGRRRTQIFFFTEARHPSHTGRTNAWVPNNGTPGPPHFQPANTSLDFHFPSFA